MRRDFTTAFQEGQGKEKTLTAEFAKSAYRWFRYRQQRRAQIARPLPYSTSLHQAKVKFVSQSAGKRVNVGSAVNNPVGVSD
jgi:hypothetical protein